MYSIIFSALLSLIFAVVIYRLYFHPLAAYPGPVIGRVTDWYSVYHCLVGDRHLDFMELHHRYGDIVRYGPNRLSFSTAESFRAIYGPVANTKKSSWYEAMTFYMKVPSTHATTDKRNHLRKRRILGHALSERMVHVYEDGYKRVLKNFLERCRSTDPQSMHGWSRPFNMSHEFTLLSFDAMGQFCFGESCASQEDPKKAEIIENTLEGFRGLNAIGHMLGLAWLHPEILQPSIARSIKAYEAFAASLASRCIERFSEKGERNTTLNCVFDILYATSQNPKVEGFSLPELQSESSLLVTTGTDTTSGCLANVLFHLVEHPDTMTNLITEIRGTFEDVSEIRIGQKLNNCKLLSACIDESLRLSPIVGGCLMRQVGPGGITVNGRLVPEGVDVGVPHHVVMRNPKYYTEPLEFKPRRWLQTETTEKELALARSAFCPFGIGPTGCIGRAWAVVEMKLTLANILFEYDLMKDMDKPELSVMQRLHERDRCGVDRFIITNQGPYIRFRPAKLG